MVIKYGSGNVPCQDKIPRFSEKIWSRWIDAFGLFNNVTFAVSFA
jgi:hypothetical protein